MDNPTLWAVIFLVVSAAIWHWRNHDCWLVFLLAVCRRCSCRRHREPGGEHHSSSVSHCSLVVSFLVFLGFRPWPSDSMPTPQMLPVSARTASSA